MHPFQKTQGSEKKKMDKKRLSPHRPLKSVARKRRQYEQRVYAERINPNDARKEREKKESEETEDKI
jgi:hypothetical protein